MSAVPHISNVYPPYTPDQRPEYRDGQGDAIPAQTADWLLALDCMATQPNESPCLVHALNKEICTCSRIRAQYDSTGQLIGSAGAALREIQTCTPYSAALAASCWTRHGAVRETTLGKRPQMTGGFIPEQFNAWQRSLFTGTGATDRDIATTLMWFQGTMAACGPRMYSAIRKYKNHWKKLPFTQAAYNLIKSSENAINLHEGYKVPEELQEEWSDIIGQPEIHTTFSTKLAEVIAERRTAEAGGLAESVETDPSRPAGVSPGWAGLGGGRPRAISSGAVPPGRPSPDPAFPAGSESLWTVSATPHSSYGHTTAPNPSTGAPLGSTHFQPAMYFNDNNNPQAIGPALTFTAPSYPDMDGLNSWPSQDTIIPSRGVTAKRERPRRTPSETPWDTAMYYIDEHEELPRSFAQQSDCWASFYRDQKSMFETSPTAQHDPAACKHYDLAEEVLAISLNLLGEQSALTKDEFTSQVVDGGDNLRLTEKDDPMDLSWVTAWKCLRASNPDYIVSLKDRISHPVCTGETGSTSWVGSGGTAS